jgi:ketosteroid isomerase-like protein
MTDDLLQRLFRAIDAMDLDGFTDCLTADATFRFGSAPPVTGTSTIRDAVGGFFSSIAALRHVLDRTVTDGDTLICEGTVTYTRHDGSQVTLPFANVFELQGRRIHHYKIYADIAPLYATQSPG